MHDQKTNWTLFVPIYNLEIAPNIKGELRIGDVLFVSTEKISRIRKRLGLHHPLSYYRSSRLKEPISSKVKVYACMKTLRKTDEHLIRELKVIKKAIFILASSQFYRIGRDQRIVFGIPEIDSKLIVEYALFENSSSRCKYTIPMMIPRLATRGPFRLDTEWKKFISNYFFIYLLKIINGYISVEKAWRDAIQRAAMFAGMSHFALNSWEAFLYDMIAIEILLSERNDKKINDKIVKRLFALFGWMTNEDPNKWKRSIEGLYKIRSAFVHKGETKNITIDDLLYADLVLANLLEAVCRLTREFQSKKDIEELARKIEARRNLGQKPLERPKGISFHLRPLPSAQDREQLEKSLQWFW